MRRTLAVLLVAAALTGCGDRSAIRAGGRVPGKILTVFVLTPREGPYAKATGDLVRGAKLALAQAHGRVGGLTIQFAAVDEPDNGAVEAIASAARVVASDSGAIAVIADLNPRTAAVTAPIFNAVGLLHVSPISPQTFTQPAAQPTFVALGPTVEEQAAQMVRSVRPPVAIEQEPDSEALADAIRAAVGRTVPTAKARTVVYAGTDPVNARGVVESVLRENPRARVILPVALTGGLGRLEAPEAGPPGFAAAYPGVKAGAYATVGYRSMNAVLAALRSAGRDAQQRSAVIRAFAPPADVFGD